MSMSLSSSFAPYLNALEEIFAPVLEANQWSRGSRGRGRGQGRGRGGGRGRGWGRGRGRGRGGRYNWNNGQKSHRGNPPLNPGLIEPKKIFVYNLIGSVTEEDLRNHLNKFANVVDVSIIRKPYPTLRLYAFVTFETEEDTQKILQLDKLNRTINGRTLEFNPARMQFKLPGMPGFQRTVLSDREFDLEPEDPTEPSIHILIDDVLLKILEYLPLEDQLCIDRVCRRWQSLLHASFRSKATLDVKSNVNMWLRRNGIMPTLPVISKVLILCGELITSLIIEEFGSSCSSEGKILRIVGQLCPSLEALTLNRLPSLNIQYLKDFVNSCPNLKSFNITDRSSFNDTHLTYLLTSIPTLESLTLEGAEIYGQCFNKLPDTLEVLELSRCNSVYSTSIHDIPARCPLIKTLRLGSINISLELLAEIGNKCSSIEDLSIKISGSTIDMNVFKNLKILRIVGHFYSVNILINSLPQLEELYLDGIIKENSSDAIDFSVLPNLRVLVLPLNNSASFSSSSIKTISFLTKLVTLRYKGCNEHKTALLEIIRRCQSMAELDCLTVTLNAEDIDSFVEASKRRTNRLKFVIGLDQGAMEQIEKLNDAKYDVEMFDADNLFSDTGGFFADFDAYDNLEDMLDDFDYSVSDDSEGSYEDLWGDIDDIGFAAGDWEGWEHLGLHPVVNWRWHDDDDDWS